MILFSIIIPTYNRAHLLRRCLDSVIAQTYTKWEAIVVDNHSEDNTKDIIDSYCDSRIKFVQVHNEGVIAKSRNMGIRLASGDWICFLDSDDYWKDNKLQSLTKYTDKYDIIYHDFILLSNEKHLFHLRGVTRYYTVRESSLQYVIRRGDPFCTSCTAVRRSSIGNSLFSEDKSLVAIEDYDFFLSLLLKNVKVKHIKSVMAFYDETTGISHTCAEMDRTRLIIQKYRSYLTREEFRDVLKLYVFKRGGFISLNQDYNKAMDCYVIAMSSSAWTIKYKAVKAYLKLFVKRLIQR